MYITPYFGGCKYTNNFLFINKNIVFQHFVLLITCEFRSPEHHRRSILPRHQSPVIHSHPLPDRPPWGSSGDILCHNGQELFCLNVEKVSFPDWGWLRSDPISERSWPWCPRGGQCVLHQSSEDSGCKLHWKLKNRLGRGFSTGSGEVFLREPHQNRVEMPEDVAGTA